jgi:hypothetical protein
MFFSANTILATECPVFGTPSEELKYVDAVFSGKVVAKELRKITDASSEDFGGERLFVKLKTDKWWKGSGDDEIVLRTSVVYFSDTIKEEGEGFRFHNSESYLVYAFYHNGVFGTSGCTRTRTLSEATEDLKELGEGFAPKIAQNCPTMFSPELKTLSEGTRIYNVRFENLDPKLKLTYKWSYFRGGKLSEIKSGQGTTSVTIDKVDLNIGFTVRLEVGGLPAGCINKVSESGSN